MHLCAVFLKEKMSFCDVFDSVKIVRYPINTVQ